MDDIASLEKRTPGLETGTRRREIARTTRRLFQQALIDLPAPHPGAQPVAPPVEQTLSCRVPAVSRRRTIRSANSRRLCTLGESAGTDPGRRAGQSMVDSISVVTAESTSPAQSYRNWERVTDAAAAKGEFIQNRTRATAYRRMRWHQLHSKEQSGPFCCMVLFGRRSHRQPGQAHRSPLQTGMVAGSRCDRPHARLLCSYRRDLLSASTIPSFVRDHIPKSALPPRLGSRPLACSM